MKMLKNTARLFLALATIAALAGSAAILAGCKHIDSDEHSSAKANNYTCPMHPEVVQNSPGKCPKCGMEMVHKD